MDHKIDIHDRLLIYGIRIVRFCKILARNPENRVIADQLIRAGTSVGANMQEADAASSRRDFINKVNISKKEVQKSNYWLKIVQGSEMINNNSAFGIRNSELSPWPLFCFADHFIEIENGNQRVKRCVGKKSLVV